jgi:integrase
VAGINKLTGADLRRSKPGLFGDGGNLWLQVTKGKRGPSRSWIFRYERGGRMRSMGLGSLDTISLTNARERARKCREQLLDGIDPIEHRTAERAAKIAEGARSITFEAAAAAYIAAHRDEWRSQQHAAQWPASLAKYIHPILGRVPVAQLDTPLILQALQPIWPTMTVTASRLRARVEAILDWATVSGYRAGDNPARWSGHLEYLLSKPAKRTVEHHPAMPWRELPAFMAKLRAVDGVVARALEFTVLCASRRNEAREATWGEIDLATATWTIPGKRMKGGKEHRVPLAPRAVTILREMHAIRQNEFVFPAEKRAGAFDKETLRYLLRRLGHGDITVHGFRSSFRTWAGEATAFAHEVCEQALAHTISNAVERAYQRGDLFEKRRRLMEAWATFCGTPAVEGAVIPMRAAASAT